MSEKSKTDWYDRASPQERERLKAILAGKRCGVVENDLGLYLMQTLPLKACEATAVNIGRRSPDEVIKFMVAQDIDSVLYHPSGDNSLQQTYDLCLKLAKIGKKIGVVYSENNITPEYLAGLDRLRNMGIVLIAKTETSTNNKGEVLNITTFYSNPHEVAKAHAAILAS